MKSGLGEDLGENRYGAKSTQPIVWNLCSSPGSAVVLNKSFDFVGFGIPI